MRKVAILILSVFILFGISISCGEIPFSIADATEASYYIKITANINGQVDPVIYIRTNNISLNFNYDWFELTIKEGYISESPDGGYILKVENAKFSLPFGGKVIIINRENGTVRTFEHYPPKK